MSLAVHIVRESVLALLGILQLAMFVRAILSWFDPTGESKFSSFLYVVTEPVILPIRALCVRMHWFENLPMDIPFMLTWLMLMVLELVLTVV